MAAYELVYFNGKGLAEVSRLLLAVADKAFTDSRFPLERKEGGGFIRPEFDAAKASGAFPMGQVPILRVTEGGATTVLSQSKAIERYLAGATGLMGASALEAAQIDGVGELLVDVRGKLMAAKDDAAKDAAFAALATALGHLEKYIAASGSGFLVGSKLSLADVQLYAFFQNYYEAERARAHACLAAAPHTAALVARVAALPAIAAWEAARPSRGEVF